MKSNNIKGSLILLTASFIWGLAFVAQSAAAELVPPFIFNALRSFIGALVLYLFWLITNKDKSSRFLPKERTERKNYYKAALACGICLAVSINLQQFGIALYPENASSEARAGFITSLYVILVPIFSVFIKKKIAPAVWLAVAVALAGVYMLCMSGGISGIYMSDLLIFLCTISFTLHIFAIDKYVGFTGGVKLSILQFLVCGIISLVPSLIFELGVIDFGNILKAMPQILYMGIMSSGVAYTFQIVGQKYAEPAVASISMSFESVFAALGGWLISGNALSNREIIGCVLVFAAIIVAQIPDFIKNKV